MVTYKGANLTKFKQCCFVGHHSLSASRYSPYSSSPSPHAPYSPSGHRSTHPKPLCVDVGTNTSLPGCVNGRSPDLPANPVTWSVEQVVRYVRSTDCINYANIFLDQVIIHEDSCFYVDLYLKGPQYCMRYTEIKTKWSYPGGSWVTFLKRFVHTNNSNWGRPACYWLAWLIGRV